MSIIADIQLIKVLSTERMYLPSENNTDLDNGHSQKHMQHIPTKNHNPCIEHRRQHNRPYIQDPTRHNSPNRIPMAR